MPSNTHNWTRLYQVFAAKFVLEVMGGGGAIWGFSEVCTFRTPVTQERWRLVALVVGSIFMCRFVLNIIDFLGEMNGKPYTLDQVKSWKRFCQIFSARFILEVWGGGGAIWGFSEALTLRKTNNLYFWRPAAGLVGGLFFVRMLLQMHDYVLQMRDSGGYLTGSSFYTEFDKKRILTGIEAFTATMVLQVFGGAGAIWGFCEVLTLRRHSTQFLFIFIANIGGCIFFARWLLQLKDFMLETKYEEKMFDLDHQQQAYDMNGFTQVLETPELKNVYEDKTEGEEEANEKTPLVVV